MKRNLIILVIFSSVLAGCASKSTPYQLAKAVDIDYRLPRNQIPLGVTQEKISDMEYRISAKVSQYTSKQRATSMALYHAAILAEKNGFDAIFVLRNFTSSGCSRAGTTYIKRTSQKSEVMHKTSVTEAEPLASIKIKFTDYKSSKISKKLKRVETLKAEHKAIIDYVPTDEELEKNWESNLDDCKKMMNGAKTRVIQK